MTKSKMNEAPAPITRGRLWLISCFVVLITVFTAISSVIAQTVVYTDEAAYLSAISNLGLSPLVEDFEGSAWDGVRSSISLGTHVAPSVTSQNITWTASDNVTTSEGAGRTGWGVYDHPGGDPDILYGASTKTLYGVAGWLHTSTPVTNVQIYLDGVLVDGGSIQVGTSDIFLGVIDEAGFSAFELRDTEGAPGDEKHWFADDFTFAATAAARVPALSGWGELILALSLLATAAWGYRHRSTPRASRLQH